jgi:predicted acylesterase/phospholipase RssA
MEYTHVVMSGGSLKCLTSLGCLRYYELAGHLTEAKCYVGVSAGAMLSLLLAIGMCTDDIIKFVYSDIMPKASTGIRVESVLDLPGTLGLDSGEAYVRLFEKVLMEKTGKGDMTFSELHDACGVTLAVGVTNVTQHRFEYWDRHTQPDTSVLLAVRASISIPMLFTPVWHDGCCYVDGGLLNNFPLDYVDAARRGSTLAIRIVNAGASSPQLERAWTLLDYVRELLATVTDTRVLDVDCHTLLEIDVDEPTEHTLFCFSIDKLQFDMTADMARHYIQHGYSVAKCASTFSGTRRCDR